MKNQTAGDFLGGVPKDCFQSHNPCSQGSGCGQACVSVGEAGDRAVLEKTTAVGDPSALQRAIDSGTLQPLSPEAQQANLDLVMARQASGGGHLSDNRCVGTMQEFRSAVVATHPQDLDCQQQQQTVVARGQIVG